MCLLKPCGWAVNSDCKTHVAEGNPRLSVGLGVGGPWSVDRHLKKPERASDLRFGFWYKRTQTFADLCRGPAAQIAELRCTEQKFLKACMHINPTINNPINL